MKTTLIQALVSAHDALARSKAKGNVEWVANWTERIRILSGFLPSGSGIDNGTKILECTPGRVVLECSYHHMDENGCYDGWTDHRITVRPDLQLGFYVTVGGRDRNEIKEYLGGTYHQALSEEVES